MLNQRLVKHPRKISEEITIIAIEAVVGVIQEATEEEAGRKLHPTIETRQIEEDVGQEEIVGADAVTNKILPSSLCGVLTGQHLYLSVKDLGTGFITIEITLSSQGSQEWEMLITQIESDATDDLAPRGCLQYFKEDAATFSSFNWNGGNGELINNNQYSVCIMDNDAYCDVALTANSMFELTESSGTCMDKIAFGTNVYCGTTFNDATNMATWNFTGSYQIPVFTDGDNTGMAVGFEISYVLLPC